MYNDIETYVTLPVVGTNDEETLEYKVLFDFDYYAGRPATFHHPEDPPEFLIEDVRLEVTDNIFVDVPYELEKVIQEQLISAAEDVIECHQEDVRDY